MQRQGLIAYIEVCQATLATYANVQELAAAVQEPPNRLRKLPENARAERTAGGLRAQGEVKLAAEVQSAAGYVFYELARASRADDGQRSQWLEQGEEILRATLRRQPKYAPAK